MYATRHAKMPNRISSNGLKRSTIGNVVTRHSATVHRLSSRRSRKLLRPVSMETGEVQIALGGVGDFQPVGLEQRHVFLAQVLYAAIGMMHATRRRLSRLNRLS